MWRRLIEAEAEEEAAMQYAVHLHSTLYTNNNKWAHINFFHVLFFCYVATATEAT